MPAISEASPVLTPFVLFLVPLEFLLAVSSTLLTPESSPPFPPESDPSPSFALVVFISSLAGLTSSASSVVVGFSLPDPPETDVVVVSATVVVVVGASVVVVVVVTSSSQPCSISTEGVEGGAGFVV